jgi:sporulation protein YlmC with PRC-barrel domain
VLAESNAKIKGFEKSFQRFEIDFSIVQIIESLIILALDPKLA